MASAKDGYPARRRAVRAGARGARSGGAADARRAWQALVARLDDDLIARVEDVVRLTPTIVEVIVQGAGGGAALPPGQFYRLQNYESAARRASGPTCRC